MTVSISVMAHPSRSAYFPHLEERLGDVPWVVDHDSQGPWPTARRAWELHDPDARFHVVVQDDALVCRDFRARAAKVLRSTQRAYSLYYGGNSRRADKAAKLARRRRTGISKRLYWGVAIALPTRLIPAMLSWTQEREARFSAQWGTARADGRVGRFLKDQKIRVGYPLPCLVDHRVGPSLVQRYRVPPSKRTAVAFIDSRRRP